MKNLETFLRTTGTLSLEPLSPERCPLFAVFYSEFDIKVGPRICFQTPKKFMENEISISTKKIEEILGATFDTLRDDDDNTANGIDDIENSEGTESAFSIFDSTSEYIITGSELTGKIITLSTHELHIMTRPTLIADERYERNSLLFSVGIVLRRAADPRPFRPVISKLAMALQSMEVESQFLSHSSSRPQLQPLLERILLSMNGSMMECNALLGSCNALHLKLFHPPKAEALPIHDHEVPILLQKKLDLEMHEWDLSISWTLLYIDGVRTTHQIATKAEVDLEMVRACLRVLKHHGFIAMVDIFVYSNRYEFTPKATAMLAGREESLQQEAAHYSRKGNLSGTANGRPGHTSDSEGESSRHSLRSSRTLNVLNTRPSSFKPPSKMLADYYETQPNRTTRHKELEVALAELYCTCNRNVSFGDLWVALTMNKTTAKSTHSPVREKKDPIDEEMLDRNSVDSFAISPSEAAHWQSIPKPTSGGSLDWNYFLTCIDHRRFFSFGVVHGLVTRVHEYPYFHGSFPERRQKQLEMNGDSKRSVQQASLEEKSYNLARQIATLMDGTRMDDEFVCSFEQPYRWLVKLVEDQSGEKVASILMAS
ncbi:unnamed protein product [Cylindrotheca closterium]|uniref:Nitrogen permease regulator 2 n=1 Tax=Cylindrotheca closterium TaxID=2856 RepID=A0AAD2CFP1_9STRA|nr:unnamed protein product [Cylindrotheca closterium]